MPVAEVQTARSRQRILESAVGLLRREGLSGHLVASAAEAAECPLASAELFFRTDEELILAIYLRLANELEARASSLPPGGVADRFRAIMLAKFELIAPYREPFAGLFAKMLDPRTNIGVLSEQTELVRMRVRGAFAMAVQGADDAPESATKLVQSLYAAHLGLLLVWSQDRTPEATHAHAALQFASKLIGLVCKFRWTPMARNALDGVSSFCGPLIDPPADPVKTVTATEILRLVFAHRRLLPGAGDCAKEPCDQCLGPHLPRVRRLVGAGLPIHFVLPAFPAKSPNPEKTLGRMPDLGERLSLEFLNRLCSDIRRIYPPGARITICSDGLVFSDLVGVADEDVVSYGERIAAMIEELGLAALDAFHLQDLYDTGDAGDRMRDRLCEHYAESIQSIRTRLHSTPSQQALFNGIQRFLFEDRVVLEHGKSRTKIREECKDRTYEVIRRSDAWGRLVSDCFPASLRLSIHPQPPHSEKIGILLGESDDVWLTPWHGVALRQNGRFRLMKRREAEALGATVVSGHGEPSFMEIKT